MWEGHGHLPLYPQIPPHGRLRQGKRDPLHTYTATPLCPAPTCLSFPFSMGSGGCTPSTATAVWTWSGCTWDKPGLGRTGIRMLQDWDVLESGCSKIRMH